MRCFCLALLFLAASVRAESARETETWVPSGQPTEESLEDLASGDLPNSSDFAFQAEDDLESYDDDDDDDEDFSGSGDKDFPELHGSSPSKPDITDNGIPDQSKPDQPKDTVNENDIVAQNEVGHGRMRPEDVNTNVLMSHAAEESIFNKTEVLAALIAGGAVGLLFAILLILLLIYRMKKKDEGSYDLGKKPIYKKAPTAEIYA